MQLNNGKTKITTVVINYNAKFTISNLVDKLYVVKVFQAKNVEIEVLR